MALKISRILHAGYIFEHAGVSVCFDPIFKSPFSSNCFAYPPASFDERAIKTLCFNAIFISHFHEDHCSLESLDLLPRSTPIYFYCVRDEIFEMIRRLGFQVFRLEVDIPVIVGKTSVIDRLNEAHNGRMDVGHSDDIVVTPRRALDSAVDSLFQIQAGGMNILNVVDSVIDDGTLNTLARESWDMVLWPFQNMRETDVLSPSRADFTSTVEVDPELMAQLIRLNPRFIVPSSCQFIHESWSWYNHAMFPVTYARFELETKHFLPESKVVRMDPGTSVELSAESLDFSQSMTWVKPSGNQDVDYEYNPMVPSMSDVAMNFRALSESENLRIQQFCEVEIVQRLNKLPPPADTYFLKSRQWQLSLYDHHGLRTDFFYKLNCETIERAKELFDRPTWLTEIPSAKLYAALENGESLTSMYMRINDMRFDSKTEVELDLVDILDDPLVRSLFNDRFASYQASELKRILADGRT